MTRDGGRVEYCLMTVRSQSHFVSKRHRRKGVHAYLFAGEVAFSTVNNRWLITFIGISLIEFYEAFAEIGIECRRRFNFNGIKLSCGMLNQIHFNAVRIPGNRGTYPSGN